MKTTIGPRSRISDSSVSRPSSVLRSTGARYANIFVQSAPSASSRGRRVSAKPSSAVRYRLFPPPRSRAPGRKPSVESAAPIAAVIQDLPSPGLPSTMVSFRRGMYGCQSQSTSSGSTSARQTELGFPGEGCKGARVPERERLPSFPGSLSGRATSSQSASTASADTSHWRPQLRQLYSIRPEERRSSVSSLEPQSWQATEGLPHALRVACER
jgi:hypothetical protein